MKKLVYSMFLALGAMLLFTGCQEETIKLPEFTVTFNSDSDSEVKAVKVEENKKLSKPADPTKGEFIFVGWFKEATFVNAWDFDKDLVTKDITLYAKWTTVTYTVTFNTNGGSAVSSATVAKGSTAIKPVAPTKNGAAFDNWYKEAALTNVYGFSTAVNSDITLYAKWITVTRETLQVLVDDAQQVNSSNYTRESYDAMRVKLDAAFQVLHSENPTTQQIATAYTELSQAMSALVALPNRAVVGVRIDNVVEGVVYVTQGQSFNLYAYAVGANGEPATDQRVTFTYDAPALAAWAVGEVRAEDHSLWFLAKNTLTAATTVSVTVKSAENPAISKTVTLKVAGEGELKTLFVNAVNALPLPGKISYEHYDAIIKAGDLYRSLANEDRWDVAVEKANEKLRKCDDAYSNLPLRVKYSFKGNVCTLTAIEGVSTEEEIGKYTFAANGAFPAGTYAQSGWQKESYKYYQYRLTFKSDGTGFTEYREAKDANGTEATAWKKETTFTYTNQGSQTAGGMFLMTFDWEEELPVTNIGTGVESVLSASTARPLHAIFKMARQ